MTERIFETADEALGRLLPHFAVSLARMRQDDPEQMRPLAPTVNPNPRPLTKIHLRFLPGSHFHPHKRHGLRLAQLPRKPFDGVIAAGVTVVAHQVLIDPLGRQASPQALFNPLPPRLTLAAGRWGNASGRFWLVLLRTRGAVWPVLRPVPTPSRPALRPVLKPPTEDIAPRSRDGCPVCGRSRAATSDWPPRLRWNVAGSR